MRTSGEITSCSEPCRTCSQCSAAARFVAAAVAVLRHGAVVGALPSLSSCAASACPPRSQLVVEVPAGQRLSLCCQQPGLQRHAACGRSARCSAPGHTATCRGQVLPVHAPALSGISMQSSCAVATAWRQQVSCRAASAGVMQSSVMAAVTPQPCLYLRGHLQGVLLWVWQTGTRGQAAANQLIVQRGAGHQHQEPQHL